MNPEEVQDQVSEQVGVEAVEAPMLPETPATQPSAADIGKEIAASMAAYFGQTRVEGTPTTTQRKPKLREQLANLTPEQRADIESRVLSNPMLAISQILEQQAKETQDEVEERAQPLVASTGSLLIEAFLNRKQRDDRYYTQIAPIFVKNTQNVNRAALVGLSEGQRDQQLSVMWEAAAGAFFRAAQEKGLATKPSSARPPIAGGGQRTGGQPAPVRTVAANSVFGKNDDLQRLVESLGARRVIDPYTRKDLGPLISAEDLIDIETNHMDDI
jgi:hypothetical protein